MKTEKQIKEEPTASDSPFKPGECKCGVPDCFGHQIEDDGNIHIRNHPRGHVVMNFKDFPETPSKP